MDNVQRNKIQKYCMMDIILDLIRRAFTSCLALRVNYKMTLKLRICVRDTSRHSVSVYQLEKRKYL
jgi:hypothetical protein